MSNINDLTVAQLKRAVEIREEIETLQGQLESLIGGSSSVAAPKPGRRGPGRPKSVVADNGVSEPRKRRMSAAGRARIAAAARARWAKFRSGSSEKPAKAGRPAKAVKADKAPKRRFNAAARAKLSAAAKARWAKAKADGKSAL
jgi:hypothetical protein